MSHLDEETTFADTGALSYLTPVEVEMIAAVLDGRDRLMVKVFAWSGLRPAELLGGLRCPGVRWSDVYVDANDKMRIKINGGRPRSRRHIYVIEPLRREIEAYRAWVKPDPEDLMFPGPNGGIWTATRYRNWCRRKWKKACKDAGVGDRRVFELRHGYARMVFRSGASIGKVALVLGNGRNITASMYAPLLEELRGELKVSPEDAIRQAQEELEGEG